MTIKPEEIGSVIIPDQTKEVRISDVSSLDDIKVPSVDAWKKVFQETRGIVRILVGDNVYIAQNVPFKGDMNDLDPYMTPEPKGPKKFVEAAYYHECVASGRAHFHTNAWELREEVDPNMVLPLVRFLVANRIGTHKSRRGIDQKDGYKWIGTDPISYQLDQALAYFSDVQKK